MMRYIHYISAKRRLHEAEKTVIMLGGERQAPEMVRAQRDMIKLESEYYGEECVNMNFILLFISILGGFAAFIYKLTQGA
jgi:hypothetical protein